MDAALLIELERRFQSGPTIQAHLTLPATPGRVAAEQNVRFGLAHLPAAERQERSRALFSLLRAAAAAAGAGRAHRGGDA